VKVHQSSPLMILQLRGASKSVTRSFAQPALSVEARFSAEFALRRELDPSRSLPLSVESRSFTEFTLSDELDPSLALRMTREGLRMTAEGSEDTPHPDPLRSADCCSGAMGSPGERALMPDTTGDTDGSETVNLLEMKRRMARIPFQQGETFIGKLLDRFA
jgi:hypothetical protein